MAISIYDSGTRTIGTPPGGWDLATVDGPGVFVGFVDLGVHDSLEVRLRWLTFDSGMTAVAWYQELTVASATGPWSILSPPVPLVNGGTLQFDINAGTPGTPSEVPWVIYQL